MKTFFIVSSSAFLFGLSSALNGAINIDGFSTTINDRFSNDPSFVANGFDLSGVAIADTTASLGAWDDGGRWVTMVSSNVFLSVNHASFYPANGQTVTFYSSNDPLSATATRSIQSSQQIGTSDVRIGTLNAPLPPGFTFYDYADVPFNLINPPAPQTVVEIPGSPYYGENAYIFGRSPTAWATDQDIAVGRNILDRWVADYAGTHDTIASVQDSTGDPNFVSSEASLVAGDSGGPLMVDDGNGGLTIVGLNWFSGGINGFSYLGNYATEIDAYIAANPVPEPRSIALIVGLFNFALINLRRRRNSTKPHRPSTE